MSSNDEIPKVRHIRFSQTNGRVRRANKPRLRYVWLSVVAVIVLAASAWIASKGYEMSRQLEAANQLIPKLKNQVLRDDAAAAEQTVSELKQVTTRAREAGSDPLWTIAGALPWLGANFQAASALATSADDVTQLGAVPLVGALESLNWETLTPKGGRVDLEPLALAAPKIRSAAGAVGQSSQRLSSIKAEELLPQIAAPLEQAREQLKSLYGGLETASNVAAVAPDMMGSTAPRKYLLLIQNNAEARTTGGIPGALAVLEVDAGKLTLSKQTSATEMGVMSPTIPVDAEQQRIYSSRVGKFMQDVNLTPDFPTSAATAQSMWEQKFGDRLDGVVSIDPVALSYILAATGPVRLQESQLDDVVRGALPTDLTSKNVVKTLLSDVYAKIPDPALQDLYFASVAKELFAALSTGKGDAAKLLEGIATGVGEGRILAWSASKDEQAVIARYPLSGSISGANISPAQFGVYFNDGTGAKMDYYVKRTVQLVEECPANGYSEVKVRVTSTNAAPKNAATLLPEYVTGGGAFGVPEGSVQTNVMAYGPVQSNVETVSVAGKKTGFASHRHSGRPVGSVTVRLAPGQSSTVEFTFDKIVQHTEPQLSVTPSVQALKDVVLDTVSEKCVPAP